MKAILRHRSADAGAGMARVEALIRKHFSQTEQVKT